MGKLKNFFNNTFAGQVISGKKKVIFNAGYEASMQYAEPQRVYTPRIQLLFSPFGLPFVPIEIIGTNANKIIKSLTWQEDRNNPGGILQVVFTPDAQTIEDIVKIINKFSFNLYSKIWGELGVDLEDLFKPMTLCQLWVDGYHISTCTVRSCSRSASVSNETKEVTYTVVMDELGAIYNRQITSLSLILTDGLQINIGDAVDAALSTTSILKGIPLYMGIQAILSAFMTTNLSADVTFSDGFPLALRLQAQPNPIGGLALSSIASFMTVDSNQYKLQGGQTIWSYLKGLIPSPWMEFFTQSGGRTMVTDNTGIPSMLFPGVNYVCARSVPYSNPLLGTVNPIFLADSLLYDLNALSLLIGGDFIIITDDDDIQSKELGTDSINQKTTFFTSYAGKGTTGAPDLNDRAIKSIGPLNPFASGGIGTFGIQEMSETIDCTSLVGLGLGSSYVERIAKNLVSISGTCISKPELNNLLCTWFRNQSRFKEGTITTRYIPYSRAGMYLLYLPSLSGRKPENVRDIGMYYIDSLNHNYNLDDTSIDFTTTFNVIRGIPLPMSIAQTALLLFDFEVLPPITGLADGEWRTIYSLREALSKI